MLDEEKENRILIELITDPQLIQYQFLLYQINIPARCSLYFLEN